MADPIVDQVLERYENLREEHSLNASLWQDIDDLITLNQYGFTREIQPGEETSVNLLDSTAPNSNDALAAFLGGNQMSRAYMWAGLRFRDEDLNDDDSATERLERRNLRMIRAFNQSNLYAAGHQWFRDLTGLGTAILFEPDPVAVKGYSGFPGFMFHAIPLAGTFLAENADETVDTLFRTYRITIRAFLRKWGKEGEAKLGQNARRAIRDGKLDTLLNCIHATYPRDPELVSRAAPADTAMPWASVYVDLDDRVALLESGFHEFPFHVARWDKTPGRVYGRGRGHIAIPHVRQLNKAVELGAESEAMAIRPPTKGSPGAVRSLNTGPGEHSVVDRMDALAPLYEGGFLNNAVESKRITVADYRQEIREMFFAHLLQMPLGPMMTAYEFAKRLEIIQRTVGPQLGRIESEGMTPLMRRSFAIMERAGGFNDDLEAIVGDRDGAIDIEYQGPLSKNQRLGEVEGLERLIGIITTVFQMRPDAADKLSVDDVVDGAADILGVPKKNIEDAKRVAAKRIQRQQEQSQAAQADALRQDAMAAGRFAPMAQAMMGGNGGGS